MIIIRPAQAPASATGVPGVLPGVLDADHLQVQAAQAFAGELATGRVPSLRAIRARLHAGQPRAQQIRAYLAALTTRQQADGSLEHPAPLRAPRREAWLVDCLI